MRILVIHTFYKLKGGEANVVANEIELLRSGGSEVELLGFSNKGNTMLKLLQIGFNFKSYHQTIAKLKSFKPDVVHIHNLHFAGSAAVIMAIKEKNIPLVMTLHNYRLLCPSGSLFHNNKLFLNSVYSGFPWKAVKKGVYQQSKLITFWVAAAAHLHDIFKTWSAIDQLILLGEHSKTLFSNSKLGYLSSRMVVKPNFCYSVPDKKRETEASHFLYVGRLTEEKGLKVLLEAFADTELPLKIVGSGPLADEVIRYANYYPNIQFVGQLPKEEINHLLDGAVALIFPSLWYETFGMVVIEAFAMGVPVIATNLGNMKSMITDGFNGLTFEAGQSADLRTKATAYSKLDRATKETYRNNALSTYLKYYTPGTNLVRLNRIYHDAINKHSYHL